MNFRPKKLLTLGIKAALVAVVAAFLGLHTFSFFEFTFPADEWYYAFLGFGLTAGGVFAYLMMLKFDADTDLKRTIALVMLVVSVIGEVVAAGFGMQISTWQKTGVGLAPEDFNFMVLVVQVLGFLHGASVLLYFAGDDVFHMFQDDDGDGIPNIFDRKDDRPAPPAQQPAGQQAKPNSDGQHPKGQRPPYRPQARK
jgi:hypothetical protein